MESRKKKNLKHSQRMSYGCKNVIIYYFVEIGHFVTYAHDVDDERSGKRLRYRENDKSYAPF